MHRVLATQPSLAPVCTPYSADGSLAPRGI